MQVSGVRVARRAGGVGWGHCKASLPIPAPSAHIACRLHTSPSCAGAVPDDCTERALALAFGSHPALAAEVVAEARLIQQQRQRSIAASAPAGGSGEQAAQQLPEQQQGQQRGEAGEEPADATLRLPYRMLRHRQPTLQVDRWDPVARLLPWALPLGRSSAGSPGGGGGGGDPSEEAEEARLQLRQLLTLDLHGSSKAAARMVLLRRLEALVLAAPELEAEVARLQAASAHGQQQRPEGDGISADASGSSQQLQSEPPPLCVITGVGRHSRGDGGGVLRAAVLELLAQQALPTLDDPAGNEGECVGGGLEAGAACVGRACL